MRRVTFAVCCAGILLALPPIAARADQYWVPGPVPQFTTAPFPVDINVLPGQPLRLTVTAVDEDCLYDDQTNEIVRRAQDTFRVEWFINSGVCTGTSYRHTDGTGPLTDTLTVVLPPGHYTVSAHINNNDVHNYFMEPTCPEVNAQVTYQTTVNVDEDNSCPAWAETCSCAEGTGSTSAFGGAAGDPVYLATGEEAYSPGPDIVAYNPR